MNSFHSNGFWFHITWFAGGWGLDQHGSKWMKKNGKAVHEHGVWEFKLPLQ